MLPGLKERLLGLINDPAYTPLKKEELALIFDIHPTETSRCVITSERN